MAEVTEKVILPKFDKEKYFKDGEIVYGKREEVEEAADKVCADGFKNPGYQVGREVLQQIDGVVQEHSFQHFVLILFP